MGMMRFTNGRGEWGTLCPDWPQADDFDLALPFNTITFRPYDEDRKYDDAPQNVVTVTIDGIGVFAIQIGHDAGRWYVEWPIADSWRWGAGDLPDEASGPARHAWHDPLTAADMARRSAPFLIEALACLAHLRAQRGGEGRW